MDARLGASKVVLFGVPGVQMATIHHTAGPNDDSTPVRTQLRQIQAFHMFSRGWCDA